jgi:hypothetical protein
MGDSRLYYAREANRCRRQAARYEGKPEKPFLLHLAEQFEQLERPSAKRPSPRA